MTDMRVVKIKAYTDNILGVESVTARCPFCGKENRIYGDSRDECEHLDGIKKGIATFSDCWYCEANNCGNPNAEYSIYEQRYLCPDCMKIWD